MRISSARRDRSTRFGVETLTPDEKLQRIVHENPDLRFAGTRLFPNGFDSATNRRIGKRAIVVSAPLGAEFLLTKSEAERMRELGVDIPFSAFTAPKAVRTTTARTVKDMF